MHPPKGKAWMPGSSPGMTKRKRVRAVIERDVRARAGLAA